MVDGQVRTADVTDLRILDAMLEIPRERFVSPASADIAYLDLDLPVGKSGSRRLLKPMVLGKLIHAADIAPGDRFSMSAVRPVTAPRCSHASPAVVALNRTPTWPRPRSPHSQGKRT
jgi:protein-L-isoaspartate(D-aspartate) O-methyltransferase